MSCSPPRGSNGLAHHQLHFLFMRRTTALSPSCLRLCRWAVPGEDEEGEVDEGELPLISKGTPADALLITQQAIPFNERRQMQFFDSVMVTLNPGGVVVPIALSERTANPDRSQVVTMRRCVSCDDSAHLTMMWRWFSV